MNVAVPRRRRVSVRMPCRESYEGAFRLPESDPIVETHSDDHRLTSPQDQPKAASRATPRRCAGNGAVSLLQAPVTRDPAAPAAVTPPRRARPAAVTPTHAQTSTPRRRARAAADVHVIVETMDDDLLSSPTLAGGSARTPPAAPQQPTPARVALAGARRQGGTPWSKRSHGPAAEPAGRPSEAASLRTALGTAQQLRDELQVARGEARAAVEDAARCRATAESSKAAAADAERERVASAQAAALARKEVRCWWRKRPWPAVADAA